MQSALTRKVPYCKKVASGAKERHRGIRHCGNCMEQEWGPTQVSATTKFQQPSSQLAKQQQHVGAKDDVPFMYRQFTWDQMVAKGFHQFI